MATGHDMKTATSTYNGFIKAASWGTGICILITAFVISLIAS